MNRRFLSFLAITVLILAGLTSATAYADSNRHRPQPPVEQVVVIRNVSVGCTSGRQYINYHVIQPEAPGSSTWTDIGGLPDVHVEGLLLGAWHEAPILARTSQGLLVKAPYGRWRAFVVRHEGRSVRRITGPAAGPFGDLCASFVDELPVGGKG